MALTHLRVEGVRIIESADLSPGPGFNLITGANAAGKTSLLEAIYLLGTARSFRTRRLDEVRRRQAEALQVVGRVEKRGRTVVQGLRRQGAVTELRVDGEAVGRASALAEGLAVQVITPDAHALLVQGPRERRRFLDWGVFHVEHGYRRAWQEYYRALRQRNAALRQGAPDRLVKQWDGLLVGAAARLDEARRKYVDSLRPHLDTAALALLGESPEVEYRPGWGAGRDLAEVLSDQLPGDRERGFTHAGPHRADMELTSAGIPVRSVYSRGQQKLLVAALVLAQVRCLGERGQGRAVLLVDDLAAELDRVRRRALLELLAGSGAQVFITATEPELVSLPPAGPHRVFHVEHGRVRQVV